MRLDHRLDGLTLGEGEGPGGIPNELIARTRAQHRLVPHDLAGCAEWEMECRCETGKEGLCRWGRGEEVDLRGKSVSSTRKELFINKKTNLEELV